MPIAPHAPALPEAGRYTAIEDHGIIGDGRSVALISSSGTLDWCCLPQFDSPGVFASLIDADRGGAWYIGVPEAERTKQMYLPESNLLLTRFFGSEAIE